MFFICTSLVYFSLTQDQYYRELIIRNWRIDNGTARGIGLALTQANAITLLNFYNNELSDDGVSLLILENITSGKFFE